MCSAHAEKALAHTAHKEEKKINALIYIIRIYHECEGGIGKSEACRVMTNSDHEGRIFQPILTPIMDSFSCSPFTFYL